MGPVPDGRRRHDLLLGIAVVLPVVLVGLVVYWTASVAVGVAASIGGIGTMGLQGPLAAAGSLVAVAILVPLLLIGVGVGVRHRYGHPLVATVDRVLSALPAVGPIYGGLRRSRDAIAGGGEAFSEVVRVELADGVHAMAFLVDRPEGPDPADASDAADRDHAADHDRVADALEGPVDDDLVTVYLPFAPNPAVGGHLLGVREDRVRSADLSVAEGIGLLVGFGPQGGGPENDPPLGTFYAQYAPEDGRSGDGHEESAVDEPAAD